MAGGGEQDVGTVRPTMQMLSWDEKTKPMTRSDMLKFVSDPNNLSAPEKDILNRATTYGVSGVVVGGAAGWIGSGLLPWQWLVRRQRQMKHYVKVGRMCFTGAAVSLPFMWVQQQLISEMLALDDENNLLAFHTKRFLIVQRSQMMFTRTQAREVTPEEQEALGASNQAKSVSIINSQGHGGGAAGKMDVNLALQQQAFTPPAQTGYK